MLNILLGVGISGTYITSQPSSSSTSPFLPQLIDLFQSENRIELHFGKTLFVSTIGLLSLLATTLVFVPINGYWLSRSWGIFLICSYVVIMCVNVVVELRG
jgi:solute carrier family 24 (sodium/potassium/calcium exchanger), member 6